MFREYTTVIKSKYRSSLYCGRKIDGLKQNVENELQIILTSKKKFYYQCFSMVLIKLTGNKMYIFL